MLQYLFATKQNKVASFFILFHFFFHFCKRYSGTKRFVCQRKKATFAFKIFSSGKSLIQSGSENDLIKSNGTIPFVAKPLRGKIITKSGLDFED